MGREANFCNLVCISYRNTKGGKYMENKIARNRRSPRNEDDYIEAYLVFNPAARKKDGMDISAVITKDGTPGHGLLNKSINRSHDKEYHRVTNFVPDSELKKKM